MQIVSQFCDGAYNPLMRGISERFAGNHQLDYCFKLIFLFYVPKLRLNSSKVGQLAYKIVRAWWSDRQPSQQSLFRALLTVTR